MISGLVLRCPVIYAFVFCAFALVQRVILNLKICAKETMELASAFLWMFVADAVTAYSSPSCTIGQAMERVNTPV